MDMWPPFIESTAAHVPEGRSKIVFDRYHVMLHMNSAVDQVRRSEHRQRQAEGDETLKGTKYLWLLAAENIPDSQAGRFSALRALDLKTGRAWAIKESLRDLWAYPMFGVKPPRPASPVRENALFSRSFAQAGLPSAPIV